MRDGRRRRRYAAMASCLAFAALSTVACKNKVSTGAGGATATSGSTSVSTGAATSTTASGTTTTGTTGTTSTGAGLCVFGQSQFGACKFGP